MEAGTPVSHYRLLRPLGAGGMGQVYLADDALLGRHVALKFVRGNDLPDPAARKRLIHEARAAASLDHPFICKIFEVGESDDGPFIAMEYLDGQTLEERLSGGALNPGEALRIGGEIAEALDAAHRHGIVHRDLKPSNVMITADGHVKVMDFGIAKRVAYEAAATTQSAVSSVDAITGTLAYMSPEQVLGNPVTPASDLFALGILLDESITGTHPFKRQTALATATAIAHEPAAPIPPTTRGASEIDDVIQRLLAKDPSHRYASAGEVVTVLRQLGSDLSGRQHRGITRAAFRRTWLAFSSLVLVAAVGTLGWLFMRPGPALAFQERDWIVIADLENKTAEKSFDSAIESALTVAIRQSRYVNVLPRSRVAEAIRLTGRKDAAVLDEALASEVAVREGARAVLACSLASSGDDYTIDARLIDPRTHQAVMAGAMRAKDKDGILPALDALAARIRH
ncbi:MAG: protein kinase domain-containing protein, partial [Acidobacteriota bacterium]